MRLGRNDPCIGDAAGCARCIDALDESDDSLLTGAARDSAGRLVRVPFTWRKSGNRMHLDWDNTTLGTITIEGARLTAEVNSEALADAVTKAIESALGEGVESRVTQVQSAERLLAEARARAASEPELPRRNADDTLAELPEVRAKLAEMIAHFERWVDQPIPVLDGRTAREAVRYRDGREIVESLVTQAERDGRRMKLPTDESIFRRLRTRLGLDTAG